MTISKRIVIIVSTAVIVVSAFVVFTQFDQLRNNAFAQTCSGSEFSFALKYRCRERPYGGELVRFCQASTITTGGQCVIGNNPFDPQACATPSTSYAAVCTVTNNECNLAIVPHIGWVCSTGGGGGGGPVTCGSITTCVDYSSAPVLNQGPPYTESTWTKKLQTSLKYLGYSVSSCDGSYGQQTANAVGQFKSANGLGADPSRFGSNAWDVLDDKVNNRSGLCSVVEPTTYTIRMRSSIYNPDCTSQGFNGVPMTTCLNPVVAKNTAFSESTDVKPGDCTISTPTAISRNGLTYNFVEWYFDEVLQRTGATRIITISDNQPDRTARAFYRKAPLCGDSVIDTDETCDDGNTSNNDGCSSKCQLESCGNGILEGSEKCDDGNTSNNDGCSSVCQLEYCGNGILEGSEKCDDGNITNGDGCSSACQLEAPGQVCGNGTREGTETCDDGNTISGDGCSATCETEIGGPLPVCSDGIDNDGDDLIDNLDPDCHTDGDATNDGSYNPFDDNEGDEDIITDKAVPSVWIKISPVIVGRGGSASLTWGTYNPGDFTLASCSASANPFDSAWSGTVGAGGKTTATPDNLGTNTYIITCTNTEGESGSDSAVVIVPFIHEVRP